MTAADYFAIELHCFGKHELRDGEMVLMPEVGRAHNTLVRNLLGESYSRLRDGCCQVLACQQRVKVSRTDFYTYPDLLIVCGEPEWAAENRDTLTNPKVIIEVLSEATERYDRTTKFRHYKTLASLDEYVLVSQDQPLVERFTRTAAGEWKHTEFVGLDTALELATGKLNIPLREVYQGVNFSPLPEIGPTSP